MNVTVVPAQTGFAEGEMETFTGRLALMIIIIVFEVAGLLDMQTVTEEVRMQLT